jgi:hypothetical protein
VRERRCLGEFALSDLRKYSRARWSVVGIRPSRWGLAHIHYVSDSMSGCVLGERLATCAHVWILYSQKRASLRNIRFAHVYGCVGVGQQSSSVVTGIEEDIVEDILFPDHISGPSRGSRSAVRRVAMLRAITEGQRGLPPLWE